jgi:S1-C subfamily serine protease
MLALGQFLADEKTPVTFLRNGVREQRDVKLVKYNVVGKTIASSLGKRPFVGGLRVDYTSLLVQAPNGARQIPPGVLVVDVQPDSKAARANLFKDDIITGVGGVLVATPGAFYEQVSLHAGTIELTVRRGISSRPQKIRW